MKKHKFWITLLICISMFTIIIYTYKVEASDFKNISFAECKCNHTLYFLKQAKLMQEWEDEYERQLADYKSRHEDIVNNIVSRINEGNLRALFGYVPDTWEIVLLKKAITAECGYTEPDSGVEKVLCVIANRCRIRGASIYEILSARNQFETWSNGRIMRTEPSEQVNRVVEDSIRQGSLSDRNVMFFTAGRYNEYCRPAYVIGHHYFGY